MNRLSRHFIGIVYLLALTLGDLPTRGHLWDTTTGWDYTIAQLAALAHAVVMRCLGA